MRTIKIVFALCAIALSGFGIMLIGDSSVARGLPVTLLFTSVTLYLSEAVLFVAFFVGLWVVCGRMLSWALHGHSALSVSLGSEPARVASVLRRFALFQIFFIAVWSICFKGVLYTTLNPAYAHYLMAKSQSLGIAIPAELVILLVVLVGLSRFVRVSRARS